jgi:hypothetical protein
LGSTPIGFIFVPLARGRAATRAILWSVPAFLLGAACFVIYGRLSFSRTAVSNGIVDYAVAVACLPLVIITIVCVIRAIRQLVAALWPAPLGVFASTDLLQLRFGTFRNSEYAVRELDIRYPFEFIDDSEDGGFEQYLPEGEQVARMLPRIKSSNSKELINRTILRYLAGDEAEIAAKLRPAIELWRRGAAFPVPTFTLDSSAPEGDDCRGDSLDSPV